jgi:hypothetical protein
MTFPYIAKVDTDRQLNPGLSEWNFRDEVLRRVFMGLISRRFKRPAHPISRSENAAKLAL